MNDIRVDLKAFVDGELTEARAREVEAAIASDPVLQQEVHFMRSLGTELNNLKNDPEVAGAQATLDKLRKKPKADFRIPIFAASAMGIALMGLFVSPMLMNSMGSADKAESAANVAFKETTASAAPMRSAPSSERAGGPAETNNGLMEESPTFTGGGGSKSQRGSDQDAYAKSPVAGLDKEVNGAAVESKWYRNGVEAKSTMGDGTSLTRKDVERLLEGSMMIRDADISVGVKSAREAKEQLRTTIDSWKGDGAKILTTNLNSTESETKLVAELRVPESRFEETLDMLAKMGNVISEHSASEDVTNQVVDTTVRARSWATELLRLKKELANSTDRAEKVQLKSEIHEAQLALDSWNMQKEVLDKQTLFSRIHVTFVQSEDGTLVSDSWSEGSLGGATSGLKTVGRIVGSFLIYVLVYIPVWLPLALFGIWLKKRNA
ncbi:MAG: DUF4349 domain-containing protein [Fimbriimonadaceae bacterium]